MIGKILLDEALQYAYDIEEELPGCVVAGGIWRDTLLGVEVKDVDVAVEAGRFDLGYMGFEAVEQDDSASYENSSIRNVWQRDHFNVIEYCLDVTPHTIIHYIDIGLCKAAWSLEEGLILDPLFLRDAFNQTLRVYRKDWGQDGVKLHMDRLRLKYPSYSVEM